MMSPLQAAIEDVSAAVVDIANSLDLRDSG